jgi:hypothetical protein
MVMRCLYLAVLLLLMSAGGAAARCADDVAAFQVRLDREKARPTPQTEAARKALQQAQKDLSDHAEVDCLNSLARARKALAAPTPVAATRK